MPIAEAPRRRVPPGALILSLAAFIVPVTAALWSPSVLGRYGPALWLLLLVPVFLLAYYRGWRGVATALVAGTATVAITQVVASRLGIGVPDLLLGVVVVYLAIATGIGWLAKRLHKDKDEVEDMAFTDTLTHLPNRRHARVFIENEFAAAERGVALSAVLFDLDGFKAFNDRHGHQAGDEALRNFADILARTTRRMNLSARFGGEEFLSVLAGSDAKGALVFAERVRTALRALELGDERLTVSCGVATYHPGMRSPDELLAAADHALYQAKREGRNCVRLFGNAALGRTQGAPEDATPSTNVGISAHPPAAPDVSRPRPPVSLLPHQITAFGAGRRVLLVEDDDQVRALIGNYLSLEGFAVVEAGNVGDAVRRLHEEFDLVVTDVQLPGASGNELVAAAKARWPATQVIVITGLQGAQVAAEALNAGADRYLFKPFDMPELRAYLVDALSHRDGILADRTDQKPLTDEAGARGGQAREAVLKGARALVRAVEVRDPYARGHSDGVASYAQVIAVALNRVQDPFDLDSLRLACELHDVGKIGVPDAILNKEGRLTTEEFQGSSPELCVKVRGSSSMLRLGCLGDLLGLEE